MRKNLNPKLWGRNGWTFLKQCAEACDEDSFPAYQQMISLLPEVLPCEKCRAHAREYILAHPPEPGEDLVRWFQDFERAVGERKRSHSEASGTEHPSSGLVLASLLLLALCFVLVCLSFLMSCLRGRFKNLKI